MTWFSKTFFWRPWKNRYDMSLRLEVSDGQKINLWLDDCKASPTSYDCECIEPCGYGNYGSVELSLDELKKLRDACTEAIDYIENEKWKR